MGSCCTKEGIKELFIGVFCVWTTPHLVTINDWRLGALHWLLRAGIIVYICLTLFMDGAYLYKEEPAGYPSFWFSAGELYETQNKSLDMCDNPSFDYYLHNTSDAYFWNCANHSCINLHFGYIARKDPKSGFVTTVLKREHIKNVPCSSGQDPCAALSASPGTRIDTRRVGNTCSCYRQQDYFVAGVDKMKLYLEHSIFASPLVYENEKGETIGGSSKYTESEETRRPIKTCLKLHKTDKDCKKTFNPGQPIDFTIEEWLGFAGVSLDGRLKKFVQPDLRDGHYPQRRIIGVKLHVKLKYEGSMYKDQWDCIMTVEAIDGWNSIGSQVKPIHYTSEEDMEYNDDYKLGISFEFFPSGIVSRRDWQRAFWTLLAGLMLVNVAEHIVGFVAFFILPESVVYANARCHQLQYSKALAQFGISTALACQAFKEWDKKKEDKTPKLTQNELAAVFEGPFDHETARMMAATVAGEIKKESLGCSDLVELMSDGLVSIENMKLHAAKVADAKHRPLKVQAWDE